MTTLMFILVAVLSMVLWMIFSALPIMFLWDWLMPSIFGLGKITFLQACGLSLLSGFLLRDRIQIKKEK